MNGETMDPRITTPIAEVFGIHDRKSGCLVRYWAKAGHLRIYVGTPTRMAELAAYHSVLGKTVLCEADAWTGTMLRTLWDRTSGALLRESYGINVDVWRRYAHFGDGSVRPVALVVSNIEAADPDAVRDHLRCATRLARHVLQS